MVLAACASPEPGAAPTRPTKPVRIVSLDYCADQFLLKLADPNQIAAVSIDATRDFSFMRETARGLPQVRSTAEAVLARDPDLVVRSYGGGPNVSALMTRAGVPVAQLGFAQDFEGVRTSIRSMAAAFGHPERGEALIAEMNARLAVVAQEGATDISALYMTPAGVTTGEGSLVHAMIAAAHLENFETQPGWRPIPLERLARERPELIAAAFFGSKTNHPDGWSAARHPVAQRQLQELPVAAIEGAWTACGGWFLVEAVEALAIGRETAR
jgi:iron complex transport system substrate-binding protein